MNSEQITTFLQEYWCIASVLIGVVILRSEETRLNSSHSTSSRMPSSA